MLKSRDGSFMTCSVPTRDAPTAASAAFQSDTPSSPATSARVLSGRTLSSFDKADGASSGVNARSPSATSTVTGHAAAHGDSNQKKCRGSGNPAAAYNARTAAAARGRSVGAVE